MSKDTRFRWRTNPHTVCTYYMDKHVPRDATITLKPNEACVVVERGRVVGIATQTNMEVNPEAGLLSRMFGKGTPDRAFLFVFLGPHDVLIPIEGRTSDGKDITGCVGLKLEFNIQNLGRLLSLPAKGEMEIGISDLGRLLFNEINAVVKTEVLSSSTLDELRSDGGLKEDAEAGIRMSLRATFESLSLELKNAWLSWNKTEHEKLLTMQDELDLMKQRNEILDEKANEEMEVILRNRARQSEMLHRMHVHDLGVEERRKVAEELARLKAQAELDDQRWQILSSVERSQKEHQHLMDEADRQNALAAAENIAQIQRTQDQVELDKKQAKMDIAMDAFEKVQAAKRAREAQRMDHINESKKAEMGLVERMLEKGFETGATDSEVLQEMLRSQASAKKHETELTESAFENNPLSTSNCANCGGQLQASWQACPMCGTPV